MIFGTTTLERYVSCFIETHATQLCNKPVVLQFSTNVIPNTGREKVGSRNIKVKPFFHQQYLCIKHSLSATSALVERVNNTKSGNWMPS
mmetsp:Transcript_26940/g.51001  ORF Transcript_26940/g.51001 Transcript_26940/m.51001 type:complete len:89 (+) Transcript_26940:273-539(+)